MTTYNMNPYANLISSAPRLATPGADSGYGGKVIQRQATLTFNSQASGSTLKAFLGKPAEIFIGGYLLVDTSSGSTTLSVGVSGDTARFKALAAITTTNLPTWFLSNINATTPYLTDPLAAFSAPTEFLITTAAATAPSSGILLLMGFFAAL